MTDRCATFRTRLQNGDPLIGTFIKTPSSIIAEVLSLTELDVFCIDAEHAPFGPLETDQCIAAFRAADAPSLVRLPDDSPTAIRSALDCGATGILVPHVTTAEQAAEIVLAANFGEGGRGFAGSPRAASYTKKSMQQHMSESADQTTVIVQIEDLAALENVTEIATVPGVDAVFVGRIDLAVAMNCSPMDDKVISAVKRICDDSREAGTAVGMFTPDMSEIPMWRERGTSLFLLGSDQSMVLSGANELAGVLS